MEDFPLSTLRVTINQGYEGAEYTRQVVEDEGITMEKLPVQKQFIRGPRPPSYQSIALPREVKSYDIPAAIRARPYKERSSSAESATLHWSKCSITDYREHFHTLLYYEEALREKEKVKQVGKSKRQYKLRRREQVENRGGKGVLYSFTWEEEDGSEPVQINDEVHLLCGGVTFVCFVWHVDGDEVFIAAHPSFRNKPPYQVRLVEIRTAYRTQHRAIDDCQINVLLKDRQPLCTLAGRFFLQSTT